MRVFACASLYCVVDVRNTPEKYQFIPEGVSTVGRESITKLLKIPAVSRKWASVPGGE